MARPGWLFAPFRVSDCYPAVMRATGMLVSFFLIASCEAGVSQKATSAMPSDASVPEAQASLFSPDAWMSSPDPPKRDAAPGVDLDATDLDAPGPDPAPVDCGAVAAEAGFCPPPPSRCASYRWLVFYDNGECVSGSCSWEKRYADCAYGCIHDACRAPFTM
jgi:hypothetical protein